jgi:glycosyltransferase involved in cell wall biosynthesis
VKILVLTNLYPPDFLGGYELGCRQAVDALRAAGHDVRVLTAAPRRAQSQRDEAHVRRSLKLADLYDDYTQRNSGMTAHRMRYVEAHGLSAFNVHVLCETLRDFAPDVAYCWNLIGLGGLGLLAALQHAGTPWVMHLMDSVPLSLCDLVPNSQLPAVKEAFLQLCRGKFISCSQTTLDEIAAGGLPLAERSTLIPNWVFIDECDARTGYRDHGIMRIVSAGRLARHKGTDILIEAMAILHRRGHRDFTLDLFGHCSDPIFESMIHSFNLTDIVRYRGVCSQAELLAGYSFYDVFVFPTVDREPFGFAPMEAAAHGCVPVVSTLCGFSEWFIDGVDCIKTQRNAPSVADGIEKLITGELDLVAIGKRAARIIRRDFRLEVLLPKIVEVLRTAIAENRGTPRCLDEAYRVAVLAERTFYSLVQELAA